ncbi:AAA family ATPase [Gemmata sp. G18]|uniref:AAA family ATPase n=1 Tax=Gemmata palustris TaxID=2822762 RepID=A0ABS5BL02_9BACT|nr:AAA family ATPase [Gemmata palustris]MBP3954381.1 AAA family ATPase [Gemmata palustris]
MNDPVIEPIRELAVLVAQQGHKIILVSGRSDAVQQETKEWLGRNGVPYSELHMRPAGDYRQDFIIKSEILDNLLAAGNEIAFVVDDRPSVVAMWRERGLTCLQCRDWDEAKPAKPGILTLMVGTSGAGKTTWLQSEEAEGDYGIDPSHVISSDQFRRELCGDFRDQTKNDAVFAAVHAVAKTRLGHGLPTVIDATHLRRKDRMESVRLANGGPVLRLDRPPD